MFKQDSETFKYRAAKAAELPIDVVLGSPIVTITGHSDILVENYRGIIEYNERTVRIQTKTGPVRIQGKGLHIDYYNTYDMKISGGITSIEFL